MFRNRYVIISLIFILLITGCKREQKQTEFILKDKAPDSINKLSDGIDDMLKSLGDIEKLNLDIPISDDKKDKKIQSENKASSQGDKTKQNESSTQEQNSQSSSDEDANNNQQTSSQNLSKDEQIKMLWDSMHSKLEEIHINWNDFEPEGLKKGATTQTGEKFQTAFNRMTKAVENKSIIEIYDYASQSLKNLKPFYDLYKDEIGGDISVLKYIAYAAYTMAINGDIVGAGEMLSDKEENMNKIRLIMTKKDEKQAVDKVSMSLSDFKNSLPEKSRILFMIKKDIIIDNLKSLKNKGE